MKYLKWVDIQYVIDVLKEFKHFRRGIKWGVSNVRLIYRSRKIYLKEKLEIREKLNVRPYHLWKYS
jgi:hypothetical protein